MSTKPGQKATRPAGDIYLHHNWRISHGWLAGPLHEPPDKVPAYELRVTLPNGRLVIGRFEDGFDAIRAAEIAVTVHPEAVARVERWRDAELVCECRVSRVVTARQPTFRS